MIHHMQVAPEIYKANEWQKLDRIVRATIRMHLLESVYFTVQSCETAFELWKKLSETYEKKVASTIYVCVYMYYVLCIMYICMCVYVYVNEWFYNILGDIFYSRISRILRMSNTTNIMHGSIYAHRYTQTHMHTYIHIDIHIHTYTYILHTIYNYIHSTHTRTCTYYIIQTYVQTRV